MAANLLEAEIKAFAKSLQSDEHRQAWKVGVRDAKLSHWGF
jgi:hypothetical protein